MIGNYLALLLSGLVHSAAVTTVAFGGSCSLTAPLTGVCGKAQVCIDAFATSATTTGTCMNQDLTKLPSPNCDSRACISVSTKTGHTAQICSNKASETAANLNTKWNNGLVKGWYIKVFQNGRPGMIGDVQFDDSAYLKLYLKQLKCSIYFEGQFLDDIGKPLNKARDIKVFLGKVSGLNGSCGGLIPTPNVCELGLTCKPPQCPAGIQCGSEGTCIKQ